MNREEHYREAQRLLIEAWNARGQMRQDMLTAADTHALLAAAAGDSVMDDDLLVNELVGIRATVDSVPVPDLVDTDTALAAIRSGQRPVRWWTKIRRYLTRRR